MKDKKLFWPIVIVAVIVIAESIVFLSKTSKNNQPVQGDNGVEEFVSPSSEPAVKFFWEMKDDNRVTLMMEAQKDLALDAIDLEISYEGVEVNSVENAGILPDSIGPNLNSDTSLIATHYFIEDADGFRLESGENVEVLNIDFTPLEGELPVFNINRDKSLVVDSTTSEALPYSL